MSKAQSFGTFDMPASNLAYERAHFGDEALRTGAKNGLLSP